MKKQSKDISKLARFELKGNDLNVKSTLDINKINELIKSTKHHMRFAKSPCGTDARKLLISHHRASSNFFFANE